jgi:G3E family GTPase
MEKLLDVPTNIITGFFGVGKTTAIRHLLSQKPTHERWAVLVNEFGEVPIDQVAMAEGADDEGGVVIREIAGGCLCCIMNMPMQVAVAEILRRARPQRLLIEPTGLGHPAGIIDALREPPLAEAIDLRAVLCLVDPRYVGDERIQSAEAFRDQIQLADVLVANKADLASRDQLAAFDEWAAALYPSKLKIAATALGEIALTDLDLPAVRRAPLFPDAHDHDADLATGGSGIPQPGMPGCYESAGHGYQGIGWIFAPEDQFRRAELMAWWKSNDLDGRIEPDPQLRMKGVFHTDDGWLLFDRVGGETTIRECAHRRDSRIEIIIADDQSIDGGEVARRLAACRIE